MTTEPSLPGGGDALHGGRFIAYGIDSIRSVA